MTMDFNCHEKYDKWIFAAVKSAIFAPQSSYDKHDQ